MPVLSSALSPASGMRHGRWQGPVNTDEPLTELTTCGGGLFSAGGLDVKSQEAALRAAPDILIATPGRLIDHLHNCPSFHLSSIEVLILDEADRYTWNGEAPGALRSCGHRIILHGSCHSHVCDASLAAHIWTSSSLAWIILLFFSPYNVTVKREDRSDSGFATS